MVVKTSASKPSTLSIVDCLDMTFFDNISSSSMSPTADEVPFATARRGEPHSKEEEDTESFDEEDCLFMDGGDDDDEGDNGAFCHYSWTGIPSNSPTLSPQSGNVLPICAGYQLEHGKADDAENSSLHETRAVSPTALCSKTARKFRRSSTLSVRESLLAEAWERKRELVLQEEMASMKERAKPELLGRSSSDCRRLVTDVSGSVELRRSRTRSLTDHDFEELQGCIDLGFRFDQSAVLDLCDTIPALEVFCAVSQNFQESPSRVSIKSPAVSSPIRCSSPSPSPSWRVLSPGDDPDEVKGRLRHWAQAVAFNARLCTESQSPIHMWQRAH